MFISIGDKQRSPDFVPGRGLTFKTRTIFHPDVRPGEVTTLEKRSGFHKQSGDLSGVREENFSNAPIHHIATSKRGTP